MGHVTALDPLDIGTRVEELKSLTDGWFDGCGLAPSADGLDWLAGALDHLPGDLPRPHLYPTPEGGVRAEWSVKSRDLSLEIDLTAKAGRWHSLDLTDDAEQSEAVNLADPAGWAWVAAAVRRAGV